MTQQHSLTILGATGSVGKSTLELVREQPSRFAIKGFTAHTNYRELARLAHEYKPDTVVIADEEYYQPLRESLQVQILMFMQKNGLISLAADPVDCVIGAIVGIAGFTGLWLFKPARKLLCKQGNACCCWPSYNAYFDENWRVNNSARF